MASNDNRSPGDFQKSLGVWLSLVVLMFCAVVAIQIDAHRPLLPHAIPPTAARVANTKRAPQAGTVVGPSSVGPSSAKTDVKPDLSASPSKSPLIRVNVTPGAVASFRLEIRGPYSIRALGTSKQLSKGDSLAATVVLPTATGLRIGEKSYSATQLEVIAKEPPAIRVDDHLYRGVMRLFRRTDGSVSAVNVLPVEEYLASVVDSEMPAAFPAAAREAQAIVSRTYAFYQMAHADPAAVYDLFSSQRSQKYQGVEYLTAGRRLAGESESSRQAVAATHGIVCTYRGKLFCTYYSAVCGGRTTDGSQIFTDAVDILKPVTCDGCRDSEYHRWIVSIGKDEFLKAVQQKGAITKIVTIRQFEPPGSGKISRFEFSDGKKTAALTGVELRERLPPGVLRSPHFTLHLEKNTIRADGRGHGHGVGFCQWGARGLALIGKKSQEIVHHYYPGAKLEVKKY
ncbi:MAG: SpoIID/LytB domain-containing protein [Planctomycetota bacterium]